MLHRSFFLGLTFLLFLTACQPRTHFVKRSYEAQSINDQTPSDSSITQLIQPYKGRMEAEMNKVIGEVAVTLGKAQPESTLGNWVGDLVYEQAKLYTKAKVDFAVVNYGGLRIPSLPKGPLTKGKVFELMPFDNTIVVVKMMGSDLPLLFHHMAKKGGWPMSRQAKYTISGDQATDMRINDQAFDPDREYLIATNDYLANGGDQCSFFIGKKQVETGKLFRDAIIEYVEAQTEPISAKLDRRVIGGE